LATLGIVAAFAGSTGFPWAYGVGVLLLNFFNDAYRRWEYRGQRNHSFFGLSWPEQGAIRRGINAPVGPRRDHSAARRTRRYTAAVVAMVLWSAAALACMVYFSDLAARRGLASEGLLPSLAYSLLPVGWLFYKLIYLLLPRGAEPAGPLPVVGDAQNPLLELPSQGFRLHPGCLIVLFPPVLMMCLMFVTLLCMLPLIPVFIVLGLLQTPEAGWLLLPWAVAGLVRLLRTRPKIWHELDVRSLELVEHQLIHGYELTRLLAKGPAEAVAVENHLGTWRVSLLVGTEFVPFGGGQPDQARAEAAAREVAARTLLPLFSRPVAGDTVARLWAPVTGVSPLQPPPELPPIP
jgi:hypothetical protein